MFWISGWLAIFFSSSLFAIPPLKIPCDLYADYTFGGIIPVYDWYIDGSYPPDKPIVFKTEEIDELLAKASQRRNGYYGATDQYLYAMLDKYASYIEGKRIAIIGSTTPWYEAIVLSYKGMPTTIEYNKIIPEDPRIQAITVDEYEQDPQLFDTIISISSIEHDGLGRYGDPINPSGDLEAMAKIKKMLRNNGLLFLAVPIGQDSIYWNAHRVYGSLRLPLLFNDWEIIDSSGFLQTDLNVSGYTGHQPVFVLQPIQ